MNFNFAFHPNSISTSFVPPIKESKKTEKTRKLEKNNQKNRTVKKNRLKF
jgi:hypothetical protein